MEVAMANKEMDCKGMAGAMPDLLLDRAAASSGARAHLETCADCRSELNGLETTIGALGNWEAPEPSPYWMARMGALLREEQAVPKRGWAGFVERLRTRVWLYDRSLKPAAGMAAVGLVLAVGGGTWLDLQAGHSAPAVQASNTVRDLQSLNENAPLFQQLSSLDEPDSNTQANE